MSFLNLLEKCHYVKFLRDINVLTPTVNVLKLETRRREEKLDLILLFLFVEVLFKSFMLATSEN